jgi:hypothetical protein
MRSGWDAIRRAALAAEPWLIGAAVLLPFALQALRWAAGR